MRHAAPTLLALHYILAHMQPTLVLRSCVCSPDTKLPLSLVELHTQAAAIARPHPAHDSIGPGTKGAHAQTAAREAVAMQQSLQMLSRPHVKHGLHNHGQCMLPVSLIQSECMHRQQPERCWQCSRSLQMLLTPPLAMTRGLIGRLLWPCLGKKLLPGVPCKPGA